MTLFREIKIKPALFVVDAQNCFMAHGGSYDKMGFKIGEYRKILKPLKKVISRARSWNIPILFSKAIREASGIDTLDKVHKILPAKRKERIEKFPLCIRGTWDGDLVSEIGANPQKDYILEKRRDSAFRGTELEIWLKALKVDTLIFSGIDTVVCVESTLRDAFNAGYDVILLSDATSSMNPRFYKSTLEEVGESFGLVMTSDDFFQNLKKYNSRYIFRTIALK